VARPLASKRFFVLPSFLLSFAVMLLAQNAAAQQSKVLAPHKPVPPILPDSGTKQKPATPRSMTGGLWMIDANFKSSIYIKNVVETSSVVVSPVLYLSNGVKYSLSPVKLEPAGTTVISINDALLQQGIAPYATLTGYMEIDYVWPWDPVCVTITNVDTLHSLIFTYGLAPAAPMDSVAQTKQMIKGMWWKQESNVTGFVALSNTSGQPLDVSLQVSDSAADRLERHDVTVSPHGTKVVTLDELQSAKGNAGGLEITYEGAPGALVVNGGLQDQANGYSANLRFQSPPPVSALSSLQTYSELGLMTGAADPMMSFPAGTTFTPYSVVRNVSDGPIQVTPVLYWTTNGAAYSARIGQFSLAPSQTTRLDVPSLLDHAGLGNFNGTVNLILEVEGKPGVVLMAGGSVDQTNNYVFEAAPRLVNESIAKSISYWSTANGDDTMATLWNPADEAQDFLFTLYYTGGHYDFPVHLEARATRVFNVSEITGNPLPDAQGNVVPAAIHEGSAKLSGSAGESQYILVALDVGTYNVRKATCSGKCVTCNGAVSFSVIVDPFTVGVSSTTQLTHSAKYNSGIVHDLTSSSTWNSSATSVATVSVGLVSGVSPGSLDVAANDSSVPIYDVLCSGAQCSTLRGGGGSAPGKVQKPTYLYATGMTTTTNTCDLLNPFPGVAGSVHYQVLDQTGAQMTVSGMTPMEQVTVNGQKQPYATFSTPVTTLADGLFDDVPVAACFSSIPPVSKDACGIPVQNFQVVYNSVTYPITTVVTQLECYYGVRVSSTGNPTTPTNKNFSYTLGSP
jgi:hypothetical protein